MICHILTDNTDPRAGGMELASSRLAALFSLRLRAHVIEYSAEKGPSSTAHRRKAHQLWRARADLLNPIRGSDSYFEEKLKTTYLLFRSALRSELERYPSRPHMIVSFFASSNGLVAQQVATEFGLPHIASIRGSDFAGRFAKHDSSFRDVVERADWIVTTNFHQEHVVRTQFGRQSRISTIHNAADPWDLKHQWRRRAGRLVRFVADAGLNFKKASHLLLDAVDELLDSDPHSTFLLVGRPPTSGSPFWRERVAASSRRWGSRFTYSGWIEPRVLTRVLLTSDVYCSGSFSEGCAHGTVRALVLGIPIVATDVGVLRDVARGAGHVWLAQPGDADAFARALRTAATAVRSDKALVDESRVATWRQQLQPEAAEQKWLETVVSVLRPRRPTIRTAGHKPRALLYAHAGKGLGHIRRIFRVAAGLAADFDCHVLHPGDVPAWMIPRGVSFVRPSEGTVSAALMHASPDIVLVDHFGLGKDREICDAIYALQCRKVLIWRGVMDSKPGMYGDTFADGALEAICGLYDHVLATIDQNVFDVGAHYALPVELRRKLQHVGYLGLPWKRSVREEIRSVRGLGASDHWIVCSRGAGLDGESQLLQWQKLTRAFPSAYFDLVLGPKSKAAIGRGSRDSRVRVHSAVDNLDKMHYAADVVVCHGGYNSLVESMSGGSGLLVMPSQLDEEDEQWKHARALERSTDCVRLAKGGRVNSQIGALLRLNARYSSIKMDGIEEIARLVRNAFTD